MIRGTTPTLEFMLPFDTSRLAEAWITLSQCDNVVLNKRLTECECEAQKLSVRLTQVETLKLDCDYCTEIQVRARMLDGEALASGIIKVKTERILKDGVI
jgi:hypothetical protein